MWPTPDLDPAFPSQRPCVPSGRQGRKSLHVRLITGPLTDTYRETHLRESSTTIDHGVLKRIGFRTSPVGTPTRDRRSGVPPFRGARDRDFFARYPRIPAIASGLSKPPAI